MSASPPSSLELRSDGSSATAGRIRSMRAIGAMALFAIGLLLFWPTTATLIEAWEDDTVRRTYTHGYFIAAITFWLLWRNRSYWADVRIAPSVVAFVAALGTGIAWLVAYRAGLQIVHQVLVPAILFFAFAACYGVTAARRASFAYGFFYFAVPLWDAFVPLLQSASVFMTRMLLRAVGIPAYFSGNTFSLPYGSLEIADGCAGLHFFVVALAIAFLYGEINGDTRRTRAKLVIFAVLLAMVTNWVRIFIIAVAGHLTDMQHPLVSEEHYTFGWMMFVGAMVVFFVVVRRWPIQASELPTAAAGDLSAPTFAGRGVALALVGLVAAPLWLFLDRNEAPLAGETQVPQNVAGWSLQSEARSDWQPVFIAADAQQSAVFTRASTTVETFAALYASQQHGKELLGYGNSVTGPDFKVKHRGSAGSWLEMEAVDVRGTTWLLWYGYRIGEQWQRPGLSLQLSYGVKSLTSAPLSAVVAFRTPCAGDDCSAARSVLSDFAADAWSGSARVADITPNVGR